MEAYTYFNPQGVLCPVCCLHLDTLSVNDRPPIDGCRGNLIICMQCAALVMAVRTPTGGYTLEKLTQEEKLAIRRDPSAHLMKAYQEHMASRLGTHIGRIGVDPPGTD